MSYLERTAKKLLPILNEVKKRMIKEKKTHSSTNNGSKFEKKGDFNDKGKKNNKVETLDINEEISMSDQDDDEAEDSLFSNIKNSE